MRCATVSGVSTSSEPTSITPTATSLFPASRSTAESTPDAAHSTEIWSTLLRARARHKGGRILLFVDQLEELYTLVGDEAERLAFAAALAGVADDPSTPLRVVVAMRSDFLDRAAEHAGLLDRLTRGLLFLPPIDRLQQRPSGLNLMATGRVVGGGGQQESAPAAGKTNAAARAAQPQDHRRGKLAAGINRQIVFSPPQSPPPAKRR